MDTRDRRIDAYIAKSADFARPILRHVREIVHKACPKIEETMKWSFPHFDYRGEMMCSMAAFKEHCAVGFWKGALVLGKDASKHDEAMGHMGRITKISDLPAKKELTTYIKKAMELNDAGVKVQRKKGPPKKALPTPSDLAAGLKGNRAASTAWEGFSPGCRREYVEWLVEAKAEETRARRLATALEWIRAGKTRHWKYQK